MKKTSMRKLRTIELEEEIASLKWSVGLLGIGMLILFYSTTTRLDKLEGEIENGSGKAVCARRADK